MRRFTGNALDHFPAGLNLRVDILRRDFNQADMIVGMVADGMPGVRFRANQFRIAFGLLSNHKKCRFDSVLRQDLQQCRSIYRVRPIINCQRDFPPIGVPTQNSVAQQAMVELRLSLGDQLQRAFIDFPLGIQPVFVSFRLHQSQRGGSRQKIRRELSVDGVLWQPCTEAGNEWPEWKGLTRKSLT